jgi:general secretion pathway protein A
LASEPERVTASTQELRRALENGADPAAMWLGEPYGEALAVLRTAVRQDEGIILLTGEVGTGKTLLTKALLLRVRQDAIVGTLLFPRLEPLDFLRAVADAYGLPSGFDAPDPFYAEFEAFLRRTGAAGKRVLFVIDEAQGLPPATLNSIERLLRPERGAADDRAAFNVLLVGQDELRAELREPRHAALARRITAQRRLRPLTEEEVGAYLTHRLAATGAKRAAFTAAETREIHRGSSGLPRLINQLAQQAIGGAGGVSPRDVARTDVERAKTPVADVKASPGEVKAPPPTSRSVPPDVKPAPTPVRPTPVEVRPAPTEVKPPTPVDAAPPEVRIGPPDASAARASVPDAQRDVRDVKEARVDVSESRSRGLAPLDAEREPIVTDDATSPRHAREADSTTRHGRRAAGTLVAAAVIVALGLGFVGYHLSRGRDATVQAPAERAGQPPAAPTPPVAQEPGGAPVAQEPAKAPTAAEPSQPTAPQTVSPPAAPELPKSAAAPEPANPVVSPPPKVVTTPDVPKPSAVKAPAGKPAAPRPRVTEQRGRTGEGAQASSPAAATRGKSPADEQPTAAPAAVDRAPARTNTAPAAPRPSDDKGEASDGSGIIDWLLNQRSPGR